MPKNPNNVIYFIERSYFKKETIILGNAFSESPSFKFFKGRCLLKYLPVECKYQQIFHYFVYSPDISEKGCRNRDPVEAFQTVGYLGPP